MLVQKFCTFTEEVNEMELPVTQAQLDRIAAGEYVQDVVPHLNATEREFLITGLTPEEQELIFAEIPEDMIAPSGDWDIPAEDAVGPDADGVDNPW